MNVILLGLRGSGKTTVGRILAERTSRSFVDLDNSTIALLGCETVTEAWTVHGVDAFRIAESRALADALGGDGQVIALGGGTPTAPGAADVLRTAQETGRAMLIYLAAGADLLRRRLAATDQRADRPALLGTDPLSEIDSVLTVRHPLYSGLAAHAVDAAQGPEAVAEQIIRLIGRG
jgi:shikimate kinase